jgi:hypothetical protein
VARTESRQAQTERAAAQAAGRFVRSLHVLLRSARLYQKNHPRFVESLEGAEESLRAVHDHAAPLAIRFDHGCVVFRGQPLSDSRGEMKSLAEDLSGRGVSVLVFSRETNLGELNSLAALLSAARSGNGHATMSSEWPHLLERQHVAGIRINVLADEKKADAALGSLLTAVLQLDLKKWRDDEEHEPGPPAANSVDELIRVLRLLNTVAKNVLRPALTLSSDRSEAPHLMTPAETLRSSFEQATRRTVLILVAALQNQVPREAEDLEPYFSRLAESLVLRLAGEQLRAEQLDVPDLRPLFERVAREVAAMAEYQPGAAVAELRLLRVPPSIAQWTEEAAAEHLHQMFWEELPAKEKSEVLRDLHAWCVPADSLAAHLENLVRSGGEREARLILLNYVSCLNSKNVAARRAVAAGLSEFGDLAEALWPSFLPEELSGSVLRALVAETAPDVSAVLASVTSGFVRLALKKTDLAEFERILLAVEAAPRVPLVPSASEGIAAEGHNAGSDAEQLHLGFLTQSILQESNFRRLMEVALDNRPLDEVLPRILARDPTRVIEHLTGLLAVPGGVEMLPAMARLMRAIGEPAIGALVTQVFDPRGPRATAAVKLLAATRPERLVEVLARALPSWDWNLQDMAVSELTRIQPAGLPSALLEAMPHAHPLVVPMMVDEVGLARELAAMPLLMEIASGEHERFRDVFVRIKAIEALGRLGSPEAADLLRQILRTRTGLMHIEPAGLRAAAEEALGLIENRPSSARVRAKYDETERVSQAFAGQPGTRPRRYLRFPLPEPLPARIVAASAQGSAMARVQTLSLGGAFLESSRRLNIGDALTVEIKAGLRSFQSTAVVRNITPAGGGVEFVHMKQDDREKLRRYISRLSRG